MRVPIQYMASFSQEARTSSQMRVASNSFPLNEFNAFNPFFLRCVDASASSALCPNLRRMPSTAALAHQTAKESAARRDSKSTTPQHKSPMLLYFWAYSYGPVFFFWIYLDSCRDFFSGINRRKVLPLKLFSFWWQHVCFWREVASR